MRWGTQQGGDLGDTRGGKTTPSPAPSKAGPLCWGVSLFTLGFGLKPLVGRLKAEAKKRQGRKVAGGETDG